MLHSECYICISRNIDYGIKVIGTAIETVEAANNKYSNCLTMHQSRIGYNSIKMKQIIMIENMDMCIVIIQTTVTCS